jgi:hypothetical protein
MGDFPILELPDPPIRPRSDRVNYQHGGRMQSSSRMHVSAFAMELPQMRSYLAAEGDGRLLWTEALSASGFVKRPDLSRSGREVWRSSVGAMHGSFSASLNLDGTEWVIPGCRTSITIEGEAGEPVYVLIEPVGLYRQSEDRSVRPSDTVAPELIRFCDANLSIVPEHGEVVVPIPLGFQVASNPTLLVKKTWRRTDTAERVDITGLQPLWSVELERDKRIDWLEHYRRQTRFRLSMYLSGPLDEWGFLTPELSFSALASEPEEKSGQGGIRTVNLVFGFPGKQGVLEVARSH